MGDQRGVEAGRGSRRPGKRGWREAGGFLGRRWTGRRGFGEAGRGRGDIVRPPRPGRVVEQGRGAGEGAGGRRDGLHALAPEQVPHLDRPVRRQRHQLRGRRGRRASGPPPRLRERRRGVRASRRAARGAGGVKGAAAWDLGEKGARARGPRAENSLGRRRGARVGATAGLRSKLGRDGEGGARAPCRTRGPAAGSRCRAGGR